MSDLSVAIIVASAIITLGIVVVAMRRRPTQSQQLASADSKPTKGSVEKSIAETEALILSASYATAHRKEAKWYFTQRFEDPSEGVLAVAHFKRPEGTPFRVGKSVSGNTLIAVWTGKGEPTAEDEAEVEKNIHPKPYKEPLWSRIWYRICRMWPW